jgi:hypothetical protein
MRKLKLRFLASLLMTDFVVYMAGNIAPPCDFCGRQQGWPVTYYTEAGLVGDAQFSPNGLLADFMVSVVAAMVLTVVWSLISKILTDRIARGEYR